MRYFYLTVTLKPQTLFVICGTPMWNLKMDGLDADPKTGNHMKYYHFNMIEIIVP